MPRLPAPLAIALVATVVYATVTMPRGADPEFLQRAGRLKGLSERHAREVLLAASGIEVDLAATRRSFFETLDRLVGPRPARAPGTDAAVASASPSERADTGLRGRLLEEGKMMSGVIVLADRLLATPRTDPNYVGRMQEFFAASEILSNEADLVLAQAARSSSDAAAILRWQAGVGLAAGVLGVLVARRQRSAKRALVAEASARREAEEALRESERKSPLAVETVDVGPRRRAEGMFEDLLEAAPDAIVILDADRQIVLVNSQTENLFRYSKQELLGRTVDCLVPDLVGGDEIMSRAEGNGSVPRGIGFDLYGRRSDGSEFPVEISFGPLQTERGILVTTIIRDITDRKRREELEREKVRLETEIGVRRRAEVALRLQKERAQKYLDVAKVMLVVIDADETVSLINARGCEVLGRREDEVLGRNWFDIFLPGTTREEARVRFRELIAGQVTIAEHDESRVLTKLGEERLIAWKNTVLTDDEGRICATLSSGEDVTERRRDEEALRKTTLELAQSNRELEQFAYAASHDLQEPLRMVASYTRLLAVRYTGRLDKDADEFIGFAVDGATRMGAFIEGLLDYSRLGHGRPTGERVNCSRTCDAAIENLRSVIQETAGQVTRDDLPSVEGEPTQLLQLFQNLISNALKFRNSAPPRVHVSAKAAGACWEFSVRDNGIGLDPAQAERIFAIFQRLHTASEYPGTGIGLAICRRIVENHGGQIRVESRPGEGATFYFTIPGGSA